MENHTALLKACHRSNRANWLAVARSRRLDGNQAGVLEAVAKAWACHQKALWAL